MPTPHPTTPTGQHSTCTDAPPDPTPNRVLYLEATAELPTGCSDWRDHADVPIRYAGLPTQHVALPRLAPPQAIAAATQSCIDHHRTDCTVCRYLTPLYNLTLGAALTITAATAILLLVHPDAFTGITLAAVAIIYATAITAVLTATRHRRQLPMEMLSRVSRETRERGTVAPLLSPTA